VKVDKNEKVRKVRTCNRRYFYKFKFLADWKNWLAMWLVAGIRPANEKYMDEKQNLEIIIDWSTFIFVKTSKTVAGGTQDGLMIIQYVCMLERASCLLV
jgi:hypothetical protein